MKLHPGVRTVRGFKRLQDDAHAFFRQTVPESEPPRPASYQQSNTIRMCRDSQNRLRTKEKPARYSFGRGVSRMRMMA